MPRPRLRRRRGICLPARAGSHGGLARPACQSGAVAGAPGSPGRAAPPCAGAAAGGATRRARSPNSAAAASPRKMWPR
eukprot:6335908-Alexandrium_andersonii.AAC.1